MISLPEKKNQNLKKKIFIGNGNNEELIRSIFKDEHKFSIISPSNIGFTNKFFFKWVQLLKDVDFSRFNENSQIVNHIQNIKVIASKTGLHQTLVEFDQKHLELKELNGLKLKDFYPLTFILDTTVSEITHEENLFRRISDHGIWIYKPSSMNCGRGITLINDIVKFKEEYFLNKKAHNHLVMNKEIKKEKKIISKQSIPSEKKISKTVEKHQYTILKKGVIQSYIEKPLLLDGRKFDYRCYCLIASTKPFLALFHTGYLRLSINKYNMENVENADDRYIHLTNASVQKKHPNFKQEKENTIWSIEKFEKYLSEDLKFDDKEIRSIHPRIKSILTYVMLSAEKKINRKCGTFELLGCDILFDENLKPHLLEINTNPAIFTDTKTQTDVIPKVVADAIDIVLNLNEKPGQINDLLKKKEGINFHNFEILYNEQNGFKYS